MLHQCLVQSLSPVTSSEDMKDFNLLKFLTKLILLECLCSTCCLR